MILDLEPQITIINTYCPAEEDNVLISYFSGIIPSKKTLQMHELWTVEINMCYSMKSLNLRWCVNINLKKHVIKYSSIQVVASLQIGYFTM